jgi:hypothetical protein
MNVPLLLFTFSRSAAKLSLPSSSEIAAKTHLNPSEIAITLPSSKSGHIAHFLIHLFPTSTAPSDIIVTTDTLKLSRNTVLLLVRLTNKGNQDSSVDIDVAIAGDTIPCIFILANHSLIATPASNRDPADWSWLGITVQGGQSRTLSCLIRAGGDDRSPPVLILRSRNKTGVNGSVWSGGAGSKTTVWGLVDDGTFRFKPLVTNLTSGSNFSWGMDFETERLARHYPVFLFAIDDGGYVSDAVELLGMASETKLTVALAIDMAIATILAILCLMSIVLVLVRHWHRSERSENGHRSECERGLSISESDCDESELAIDAHDVED